MESRIIEEQVRVYLAALGLGPGAEFEDVRRAYRRLAKKWHPDRFPPGSVDASGAEEGLKRLNEAYAWLRANTDVWISVFAERLAEEAPSGESQSSGGPNDVPGASDEPDQATWDSLSTWGPQPAKERFAPLLAVGFIAFFVALALAIALQ